MKTSEELLADLTTVDDLLPGDLAERLGAQVIAADKLPGHLWWYQLDTPPRTLFEQVIASLRPHAPFADSCIGAEWWMRAQEASSPFQFHFDRDERVKDTVVSPRTSSILYLSDVGGPTLIVDHEPGGSSPSLARAVRPRRGRFATFPGTLFHGVLPGEPSSRPRVAMFVNWWEHRPKAPSADLPAAWREVSPLATEALGLQPPKPSEDSPATLAAVDIMPAEKWLRLANAQIQYPQRA